MNSATQQRESESLLWNELLSVISSSNYIEKHVDFYKWMQIGVRRFIPHDLVIAAWGEFNTCTLKYDVASAIGDIRTMDLLDESTSLDLLMRDLYLRWLVNNKKSYALNNLEIDNLIKLNPVACIEKFGSMESIQVHGVSDRRANQDCLYVFISKEKADEAGPDVMDLLLPQIDAALRRIECLDHCANSIAPDLAEMICNISDREQDVMNWIRIGKTNYEIGKILSISPNTVKNHVKKIFEKLEVSSRAHAVAKYDSLIGNSARQN